ncbi:MAG: ribose transporter permease [Frankiales bacterium]|nr:ribose transporter permease [Frankiales bacterium]
MSLTLERPVVGERRAETVSAVRRHGAVLFIYSLVVILLIAASAVSSDFRQPSNLIDVLRQSIVLGLVTIGQTYVLLAGGIDMSVGMTSRVVALGTAVAMSHTLIHPYVLILLGLIGGGLIGFLNGRLITGLGAAPFIVTLGMMGALAGTALAISGGGPTDAVPDFFLAAYDASMGPIPVAVLVMAVIWLVAWFVLSRTRFGRNIYAVGGSTAVARLAAIDVRRTQTSTYVIAGVLSAAAGLFLLARSGVGDPSLGGNLEFQSIVAAAIGGISLYGGRGSLVGSLGAVLLVSLSSNVMNMLHVSAYYQDLALGVIVLLGVAVYRPRRSM